MSERKQRPPEPETCDDCGAIFDKANEGSNGYIMSDYYALCQTCGEKGWGESTDDNC